MLIAPISAIMSKPSLPKRSHNRRPMYPNCTATNPSAFALVGMGAFLAAATHAPIMAIIMIFEITLDYQIILPLMLACVVGYYTSVSIKKRSIYAEALKRKGAGDYRKQLAELHVRDIMKPKPLTISPRAGFSEIADKFVATRSITSMWPITIASSAPSRCTTSRIT